MFQLTLFIFLIDPFSNPLTVFIEALFKPLIANSSKTSGDGLIEGETDADGLADGEALRLSDGEADIDGD